MELILSPEIENIIRKEAEQRGLKPEELVAMSLQELFLPGKSTDFGKGESMADYLTDFIGVIDSSESLQAVSTLSENSGEKFATLLKEKYDRDQNDSN